MAELEGFCEKGRRFFLRRRCGTGTRFEQLTEGKEGLGEVDVAHSRAPLELEGTAHGLLGLDGATEALSSDAQVEKGVGNIPMPRFENVFLSYITMLSTPSLTGAATITFLTPSSR